MKLFIEKHNCLMTPKMVATLSRSLVFKSYLKLSVSRFLCTNTSQSNESNVGLENGVDFNELSSVDKDIVSVLRNNTFNDEDINLILNRVEKRRSVIPNLNARLVYNSIVYWGSKVKSNYEESETGLSKRLRNTLSRVEPDLLFISQSKMDERIKQLMELGVFSGKGDINKVFHEAPKGYFLQNWQELKKKFIYFQYSIFYNYTKANKLNYPSPHPLVKYPKIVEQSYEHIKARYLFSVFTGFQSKTVLSSLNQKQVDFGPMILDNLEDYLRKIAPNCTTEEYYVFEDMVAEMPSDEDEIIQELSELTGELECNAKVDPKLLPNKRKGRRKFRK